MVRCSCLTSRKSENAKPHPAPPVGHPGETDAQEMVRMGNHITSLLLAGPVARKAVQRSPAGRLRLDRFLKRLRLSLLICEVGVIVVPTT